jgi:putative sterol carrier protein
MNAKQICEQITPEVIKTNPAMLERINATYRFDVKGAGVWYVDLKPGAGTVLAQDKPADCNIELSDATYVDIATGKLNSQMAFLSGQFKTNNPQLAVRLNVLIDGIVRYVATNNVK